ncbi:MAG: hypothetical protein QNJ60_08865 [Xenococcaceae cyanobacterium MO_188.B19]|nr:hypothetical protein [Xenococcaceae cyanobacterium MO_188.B19]
MNKQWLIYTLNLNNFLKSTKIRFFITILFAVSLITGCKSVNNSNPTTENINQPINCPSPSKDLAFIENATPEYGFYKIFNYQIKEIIPKIDTIVFKSFNYKMTFCRANNNWTVETILPSKSENNLESAQYKNIKIENKEYQYKVKLNGDKQVIFELIPPESSEPQKQILYTLEETKAAEAGIELGIPEISSSLVYGNQIFWTIFVYRGEGFGGIATIVSYNPETSKITVIKPPEITHQIINDLVITGNPDKPTFWLATQLTGEGNPYIPSMGLVAYSPNNLDYTSGKIDSYRIRNSPIVGAIPTKLYVEKDLLWVGTGNGICKVKWQTISSNDSWECWRFAVMAQLPTEELPIYSSLLDDSTDRTISPKNLDQTVEVLWWLPKQREPLTGRYEIRQETPITVELSDVGATTWDEYYYDEIEPPVWQAPLYWVGSNWHWEGNRFVRGLDEVELNLVGGGAIGISSGQPNDEYIFDMNTMRGDLEILELTKNTTKVNYYSAWVEDNLLQPYLTVVPEVKSSQSLPNPLLEIKSKLD